MYTSGLLIGLGAQEIVIILVIVLLLFGGKKIPELMRGLGRGVKEFKDGQKDDDTTNTDARDTNEKTNNQ
jgi:sec-independent protein translocase protein TatA